MKRYIFLFLCFVVSAGWLVGQDEEFRRNAPEPGPAPVIQLGDFSDFELENGLHVIVVENHKLPRVSFQLYVNTPVFAEGAYAGTADMAGDLLRTGTESKAKAEIDEMIDFMGANLNTYANGAFASSLSRHKDRLMGILSEVILRPTFPAEEFDKLKTQNLSALSQAKEDPDQIASNVADVLRYGDHPYAELMTEQTIENITVDNCREYYTTYFKPNISYLVMVGDIDADEARSLAERYFGDWESQDMMKEYYEKPDAPASTQVDFVPKAGAVQSIVNVTYPIRLRPGTLEAIEAQLLNTILGSSFNGRLFANLREDKAYTYGAYSSISSDPNIGYFNAYASVRNEVTDSAVHEFLYELERIRTEKVADDELRRAKNMITGTFARQLENPESIAQFALNTVRYNLPRDFYPTYLKNLANVTAADLLELAEQYILPEQAHILVVGNKEVADRLERFSADGEVRFYNVYGEPQEMAGVVMPEGLTAESVIADYVDAIGGAERCNQVEDATIVMSGSVQGMDMTMTLKRKEPGMMVTLVQMSGMTVNEVVVNGDQAKMSQMGQPVPVEDDALAELQMQSEIFPEARYQELGFSVALDGMEKVGSTDAYVVKVTAPSGEEILDYYDAASGLKLRSVTASDGATVTTDFGDYQEVDGYMFPYEITSSGMMPVPLVFKVESISVNTGLDDAEFSVE